MKTFLFSDSHFGSLWGKVDEEERVKRFLQFTEYIKKGDIFVLLGDIFDFWFEYKYVIPRVYFPVLSRIAEIAESSPVYYVCGNHDLWVGDFFEDLGIRVERESLTLKFPKFRAFLTHGDRIQKTDLGGQFARFILGNRVSRALFRWVHPDLGFGLAHFVSKLSRGKSENKKLKNLIPEGVNNFFKKGYRLVVMGHVHSPLLKDCGEGVFLSLGDWIWHFTYGVIEEDSVKLVQFPEKLLGEVKIP